MSDELTKHATIRLARGYEFIAEFPDRPDSPAIVVDEPPPLGHGRAPNAVEVLAAAVGNCLSASLALCLRKSRLELGDLTTDVTAHLARNENGRLRIESIDVEIRPELDGPGGAQLARCQSLFEDFCTVTASVRQGIPVRVTVKELSAPETAREIPRPA